MTPDSAPRKRPSRPITPAESVVVVAAALEMLLLVGGLLWAINAPGGAQLWPRILLVAAIAVISAIIAIFLCAPILRTAGKPQDPSDPTD